MASNTEALQVCRMCRHVHDTRGTADERWVTKKSYRHSTGIALADCRLTYTFCPTCSAYLKNYIQAA